MKNSQVAWWGTSKPYQMCEVVEPNVDGRVRVRWTSGPASPWVEVPVDQIHPVGDIAKALINRREDFLSAVDLAALARSR